MLRQHRGAIDGPAWLQAALGIALVVMSGLVHAASTPVSRVTDSPVFATSDQAALAALSIALEKKPTIEWGGVVFQLKDGGYVYSQPVTGGERETCAYRVETPRGARLVGIYHTHPQHEADDYFSAADIKAATRLGIKSYIGVVSGRHVRVFDPASMYGHVRFKLEQYGEISPGALLQARLQSTDDAP